MTITDHEYSDCALHWNCTGTMRVANAYKSWMDEMSWIVCGHSSKCETNDHCGCTTANETTRCAIIMNNPINLCMIQWLKNHYPSWFYVITDVHTQYTSLKMYRQYATWTSQISKSRQEQSTFDIMLHFIEVGADHFSGLPKTAPEEGLCYCKLQETHQKGVLHTARWLVCNFPKRRTAGLMPFLSKSTLLKHYQW